MPPDPYRDDSRYGEPVPHTNWLPWAVVATVAAFLLSCIGMIFGIIGIVQANKANTAYQRGDFSIGDSANSTARLMTIIAFVLRQSVCSDPSGYSGPLISWRITRT